MISRIDDLVRRHRHSGILVDTNLLVMYVVGSLYPTLIKDFRGKKAYDEADFAVLATFLGRFDKIIVAAAVLAETTNLLDRLQGRRRDAVFQYLAARLPSELFEERWIGMGQVVTTHGFVRFGFADATVEELGVAGAPVLTDDFDLYHHLLTRQVEAFNFTQIRPI
jgi:hypothetical protein